MRVIFNEDNNHYWYSRFHRKMPVNERTLRLFIKQYADTDITDFSVNVNASVSSTESLVMQDYIQKYMADSENGVTVDYTNTYAKLLYDLKARGLDPYAIWFDEIKKCGMRGLLNFRMNDCHAFIGCKTSLVKSEMIEKHPEYYICTGREPTGYFDKCLNYLLEPVRAYFLSYISEQLERYDVDGIELDFTREPYCFPVGREDEGRKVMLDFLGEVHELADRISSERNKKIAVHLLCQANPITAYECGFDLAAAAKRGYVDAIIPSPRFSTVNSDIPLEIWRALVGDTQLGAVQQLLVRAYPNDKWVSTDLAMAYGQTAAFTARGADFVYLYNQFDIPSDDPDDENYENLYYAGSVTDKWKTVARTLGHTELLPYRTRRNPLTYDDFAGLAEPTAARLPLELSPGKFSAFRISTGKILETQVSYVNIETAEPVDRKHITVYVNGVRAVCSKKDMTNHHIVSRERSLSFVFHAAAETTAAVEICAEVPCRIEYMEILVCGLKRERPAK